MRGKSKILITGASGGLASLVAEKLHEKYELIGVDPRPLSVDHEFYGDYFQVDYRSRRMVDLFRTNRFEIMLHLGRVPLASGTKRSIRYNLNVLGTRNLLESSAKYGVQKIIVSSTFHVYGAHQHNHLYMTEDDPLRASQIFPEIIDAVDMDNAASSFALRNQTVQTLILRPANVIGPKTKNRISQVLRSKFCPYVLGYDPLMQFLHEEDFADAICLALESEQKGIFNVAGEGVIPFTRAIREAGSSPIPIPHFLAYTSAQLVTRFGINFPKHLVDYFRYPVVLDDSNFRKNFSFKPRYSTIDTLKSLSAM